MTLFTDLKQLLTYLKNVASDERIPTRDKAILAALVGLLISPADFIPDWIPVLGQMDDIVMLALITDYFNNVLDPKILQEHWPFSEKSFKRLQSASKFISLFAPKFLKKRVWAYTKSTS